MTEERSSKAILFDSNVIGENPTDNAWITTMFRYELPEQFPLHFEAYFSNSLHVLTEPCSSSERRICYNDTPIVSFSCPTGTLNPSVKKLLYDVVNSSKMLVLCDASRLSNLTENTQLLYVYGEFNQGQDQIFLDGYVSTRKQHRQNCINYFWNNLFTIPPYTADITDGKEDVVVPNPVPTCNLNLLLDLDGTLCLSDRDAINGMIIKFLTDIA